MSEIQFVQYIQGLLPTVYLTEGYDESKFFVDIKEEKTYLYLYRRIVEIRNVRTLYYIECIIYL